MGLCKCRVVTTLFCFQHRVNVCENCLVQSHSTCVVKTYLKWLEDNDFNPNCQLCGQDFNTDQNTIRLRCYDVFHWKCLKEYAASLPSNTAPAGYTCPAHGCNMGIVPLPHEQSRVAVEARKLLQTVAWSGLGGGLAISVGGGDEMLAAPTGASAAAPPSSSSSSSSAVGGSVDTHIAMPLTPTGDLKPGGGGGGGGAAMVAQSVVSRKPQGSAATSALAGADADEDKYARRPASAWVGQLVGNAQAASAASADEPSGMSELKRIIIALLIIIVAAVTLIEMLTRARPSAGDPQFDPMLNPNVRVED